MNITVLNNFRGPILDICRELCTYDCLDYGIPEKRFADFDAAKAFARRELHESYYIARDDVTGDYVVFSRAA